MGTDPLNVLRQRNARRAPGLIRPDAMRTVVLGMGVALHPYRISYQYVERFRFFTLFPDPILENAADDAALQDWNDFGNDGDHRVAVGGGSKMVHVLQPGDTLRALQRDYGRFGCEEVRALVGVEDADAIDELQVTLLPNGQLLDDNGEPVVAGLHRLLDRHLRPFIVKADTPEVTRSGAIALARVNEVAYAFKRQHLRLTQGEILRGKASGSGRDGLSTLEEQWAQETGFRIDPTVDVIGDVQRRETFADSEQPERAAPAVNVVFPPELVAALQRPAASEVDVTRLVAEAYDRAQRDMIALLQANGIDIDLAKKPAPSEGVVEPTEVEPIEIFVEDEEGERAVPQETGLDFDPRTELAQPAVPENDPEPADDDEPFSALADGEVEIVDTLGIAEEEAGVDVAALAEEAFAKPDAVVQREVPRSLGRTGRARRKA